MAIRGITFTNQIVRSGDDALFHSFVLPSAGILRGCTTTSDASNVYITAGQIYIQGRQVEIQGTETITPETVTEGSKYCRLVLEIDLTQENTSESFGQGCFKILSSILSYPEVTQEDLNNGGDLYQLPWARFKVDINGISEFVNDTTQIAVGNIVNSQSVTEAGHALDARQANPDIEGSLGAQINGLNSSLANGLSISQGGTGATSASAARTNLGVAYGTSAGTVCQGNDSRLSNARTPTAHTHTKSQITDFPTTMTPAAHTQAASTITAGTLPVGVVATNSTDYATSRLRNIYAGTTDMVAGTTALANGAIYVMYE